MRRFTLKTLIENRSRYPIHHVWENAQDMEHVAWIHRKTNLFFELLYTEKGPDSPFEYDYLIYRATRRVFKFGRLNVFGYRKILAPHHLQQVEWIPLLGVKSQLDSQLHLGKNKEFPTLLRDEVTLELPWVLFPLRFLIRKSVRRHAKIQCEEDESVRERRVELEKRGIHLPYRLLHEPL